MLASLLKAQNSYIAKADQKHTVVSSMTGVFSKH